MRFLLALLLAFVPLVTPPVPLVAQDTTKIKTLTARTRSNADSVTAATRMSQAAAQRNLRAKARIKVAQDSIEIAMRKRDTITLPTVVSIAISPTGSSLAVGKTVQLFAVTKDASGAVLPAPVSWSAAPTTVGDVSGTGLLTGKGAGTVTVSARSGTVLNTSTYTVTKPDTIVPLPPSGTVAEIALLPRVIPSAQVPTGYTVISVAAGQSLQAALDASPCRVELQLAANTSFPANLVLRQKPCNETIHTVFRTANGIAVLPDGQRITPALATSRQQARIVNIPGSGTPTITAPPGAGGYAFQDITILCTGDSPINGCVTLGVSGAPQTTLASVPSNFIFRQTYISGTPTLNLKRCVYLNAGATAIVDSWLSECHSNAGDSQCILGLNGPGPYLIENNYCEAGHEIIMFGGGDPSIPNLIPSDITIRRNHITRPAAWKGVWGVKNCIETKNAAYILIEANVIEGNWADGQVGYCLLFKDVNQDGTAPWSTTKHLTVRYNLVRNTGAGVNFCAGCQQPSEALHHATAYDNLFLGINKGIYLGEGRLWQFLGPLKHVSVTHNTTTDAANVETAISFSGNTPKITNFIFGGNAYDGGAYWIHGDGTGGWTTVLASTDTATSRVYYNAWYGPNSDACINAAPMFDTCKATAAQLGLSADGRLSAPLTPSFDTRSIGADADLVYQKTAGVVVADPSRALVRRRIATRAQSRYRRTTAAAAKADTYGKGTSVR